MGTKSLSAGLHSVFTSAAVKWGPLAGMGLVAAAAMMAPAALAEQKQQQSTSDHQQLCKDLYLIYDTNMDEYYNKKNGAKSRQSSYVQAEKALSDYRRQGCKNKDIK